MVASCACPAAEQRTRTEVRNAGPVIQRGAGVVSAFGEATILPARLNAANLASYTLAL